MIVYTPTQSPFGLAPQGSGGGSGGNGSAGGAGGSDESIVPPGQGPGLTADLIGKAKAAVAAFKAKVGELLASPAKLTATRAQLEAARANADQNVSGADRGAMLQKLDLLLAENQSLADRVTTAGELIAAGKAKANEILQALGLPTFGIAPLAIAGLVVALLAVTALIAKIVSDVNVHAVEAQTEAARVNAAIAGTLPVDVAYPTGNGGGGFDVGDIGKYLPILFGIAILGAVSSFLPRPGRA